MAGQLVLDAIRGRDTERVPVAPLITLPHASKAYGIKAFEYIFDSEKYAKAQKHSRRYYGYDWVFAHQIFQGLTREERKGVVDRGDHYILPLEIGTVFKIPKNGAPFIAEKAVKNKEDIYDLAVPDTFHSERLRPINLMRDEEFLCGNIRCPFTFAGTYLYEAEDFLMDTKRDRDFVHELLRFALKYCLESGKAQIEAGVDTIFIEDPQASPNLISPETFKETALPYDKRLIKELRKKVPVIFHICGDTSSILDDMIDAGPSCISLDECMKIEEVHKKIPVWGNISPKLLVDEEPETIRELSDKIVLLKNRVVLSSGCVVPANAKPENIYAMVKASHEN